MTVTALSGAPRSSSTIATDLAPVAAAIVNDALEQARRIEEAAAASERRELEDASRQAEEILAAARAEGDAAGARAAVGLLVDAHREARRAILDAHRRALDALRAGAEAELVRRRRTPEATALRARLAAAARARLGPGAAVTPDDACGVVAVGNGRRLDLRTHVLVDRHLAAMGSSVAELWA